MIFSFSSYCVLFSKDWFKREPLGFQFWSFWHLMFSFDVFRSDHQLLMVSPHHTSSSRGPSLSPVTRPPWLSRLWDKVCLKLSNHLRVLVASSSAPTSPCAQRPLDVLYLGQIKASTSPSIRRPRPSSPCDGNRGSYQSKASTGSILWTTAD